MQSTTPFWLRPFIDRKYFLPLAIILWLGEIVLNYAIINGIPPYVRPIACIYIENRNNVNRY